MSNIIKVVWYKADNGIYVGGSEFDYRHVRVGVQVDLINDKKPKPTHLAGWKFIEGESEPVSFKKKRSGNICNIRYELIDQSLASDKIPLVLKDTEVDEYCDYDSDEYEHSWKNPAYNNLRSLYERKYDREPDYFAEVPFEVEYLGEIVSEHVDNVVSAKYSIALSHQWKRDTKTEIDIKDVVSYCELEKMLVSDLLIHNRQCYLDSVTTYKIVRNYIKDNIDPKVVTVTSDYDFCFKVEKRIAIKPIERREEIKTNRNKSYRPPRFKTSTTTYKTVPVFEMTNDKDKHNGYSVIEGFKGNNLQELVDNTKHFLDDVIAYINREVKECDHCKGTGHIVDTVFSMNERCS